MDESRLNEAISEYKSLLEADPDKVKGELEERRSRVEQYQGYTQDQVLSFNEPDLVEFLGKLWALRMWGDKEHRIEKIIELNGGVENLNSLLADLLFGAASIGERWDRFLESAKGLGSAAASELLAYRSPHDAAILNGTTVKSLTYLGVPLKAKYEYQRDSSCFLRVCEISKEILAALHAAGIDAEDLLAVDYFLWDVSLSIGDESDFEDGAAGRGGSGSEGSPSTKERSYHSEVKAALEEIGSFLGFESSTEVKVATGAVVDAVWESAIGNMGKVIYAFEVQSKGSMDSAILNLARACINPAVQAVVFVSDDAQLQKLREESRGVIDEGHLRTWRSEDVLAVRDHLSAAHESINELMLVPESFSD